MLEIERILTNHCGISILLLMLRFFVPGAVWLWLFNSSFQTMKKGQRWIYAAWLSLLISFLFTTFLTIILGEFGLLGGSLKWMLTGCFVLAGLLSGMLRQTVQLKNGLRAAAAGGVACLLLWGTLLLIPSQGEWIVGGWDPGIYINHGVYISTQGTFHPEPAACYEALTEEELVLFTRRDGDYVETFTGVPIHTERRNHEIYFFRLMPSLVASLVDCGGLQAAIRVNFIVGIPALLAFAALCLAFRRNTPFMLIALCLLVTQPTWQYLLHLPTSEMLQFFLLSSALTLLALSHRRREVILAALCLFAAVINRLTFLPLGMLLLLILACENTLSTDKNSHLKIGLPAAILVAGTLVNTLTAQATINRLTDLVFWIILVSSALGFLTIIIQIIARKPGWHPYVARIYSTCFRFAAIVIPIILILLWFRPFISIFDEAHSNLRHLTPYFSPILLILSLVGITSALYFTENKPSTWRGYLLFLFMVTSILIYHKHIKNLYPWATRRFFVYTVPLCALAGAYTLNNVWNIQKYRFMARTASMALLLVVIGSSARRSYSAWTNTEYNGSISALTEVAQHISDEDIIIADHPWWGTPLTFIFNKQVLNGRRIWTNNDQETTLAIKSTLKRLHDTGKTIRFLTSTDDQMSIYAPELQTVTLDWESDPYHYQTIIQHRSATGFESHDKSKTFRLYTWSPPPES